MIISIQGVSFTYPGDESPVLRDLNLEVPQGEFMALIGNNGSGKTSLCKLLTGLIPHFFQGDLTGEVEVAGLPVRETRVAELARHVGYVYQDFENQLLKPKVLEDVSFAPLNFGMPDYRERAAEMLALLGLTHLEDRIIWELSGGEQHLVALAGALALRPEIVVVDEPISQLDPVNARTIYEKLTMLNEDLGKTVIVIEHHPDFIGDYCDSVVLLTGGHVAWKLPVREALTRIEELEQNDLFAPQVTRIAHTLGQRTSTLENEIEEAADTYPIQLEEAVDVFRSMVETRKGRGANNLYDDQLRPDASYTQTPVITFRNVSHRYRMLNDSQKVVLDEVNLNLFDGERIALVGANGAGKSTLLKLIAGLEKPTEGTIHVLGQKTHDVSPERLADHVALIYQAPQQMFIEDSIRRDVAYYLKARNVPDADERVEQVLEDFHLTALAERDGRLLSGGQMRRASLAVGACMRPKVMLLDEPTSSLDLSNRRQIVKMLGTLERWVKTVIIATHDMEMVAEWAQRIIVLRQGQVIADAPPATIFSDMDLVERARIRPPQVIRLSNALEINPVRLSVDEFVHYLMDVRTPDDKWETLDVR